MMKDEKQEESQGKGNPDPESINERRNRKDGRGQLKGMAYFKCKNKKMKVYIIVMLYI